MMDHWEVGVVLALRDVQWLRKEPDELIPPLCICLDGNAESKMGDGLFEVDERFLLLEIKPDHSFCSDEWTASTGPKRAYKKLMDLAAQSEASPGLSNLHKLMSLSTQGHFFAFWGESQPSNLAPSHFDQLYLQPYLLTALKEIPDNSSGIKPGSEYSGIPSHKYAKVLLARLPSGLASKTHLAPKWPLTLREMTSEGAVAARSCLKEPGAASVMRSDLRSPGLTMDELQTYVDFLCKESTQDGCKRDETKEDLKLILAGTRGFIRHIGNTSELAIIIAAYKEDQLQPTKGRAPKFYERATIAIEEPAIKKKLGG